ncbi:MAG: tRNA (N6-isopentenyl adenosine(37)-C2)-methylthiotransferase MiaB [Acidobacteria bacterium]|nr:tRNA (N6-isopentenyl adenosine(37)-C2)-methylthiotransferase MiaB [Acidobacteriota bacterium]
MNVSDSEKVATVLEAEGYQLTDAEESADIFIFNTCSVREKAEHKLFTRIGQVRRDHSEERAMIGVMGCVAQLEGETLLKRAPGIDFVIGTKAVARISGAIENAARRRQPQIDLGEREDDYDWSVSPLQRHSPYVAFVPIIEGCNKFCTYCIVPFSRGREKSLPAAQILKYILDLKAEGIREVHLIGQNVNSYRPKTDAGLENHRGATPFSRLLRAVAATGIERIKFTTSFPRDFHPDIVDAIDEHENLCNWVHLPVQSGSNRILKAMRRGHDVDNYRRRIDKIRSSPREISLTTDLIVGFPGETDEDFEETMKLAEYCRFDSAYYFKYSPRPGTPAHELVDDVSPTVKKERCIELDRILRKSQRRSLESQVGRVRQVLVEGLSSRSDKVLNGHTTCHKIVNFEGPADCLGKIADVRITECKTNTLFGRII